MANTLIAQLNNPAVLQRINQRAATLISVLLIIACTYVLVEVTWMMFPQDNMAQAPMTSAVTSVTGNNAKKSNIKSVMSANVFGVSEKAVVKQQTTKVPETRLNLTLKGLLAATPMELASAIIAKGKNGKEDVFSVGDKMPGGILIKEIHVDYVLLERNGSLEKLVLQKNSGKVNLRTTRSSSASSFSGSPAAALKEIRGNILKNPTSFGDYALPMLVKENGRQIGYRLQPQAKGKLLSQLGIQPSDVITKINGIKLDKAQNGIKALRQLSTAKNLEIVVKRNGVEVPLNISLQ